MKVPLLNPSLSNAPYIEELIKGTSEVLRGGQYILGETVSSFEESFARYFNVAYAVGVSSGTDALIASLLALEIGPGDEVICPSFTFFATAGAIHRVGAIPVFVDIQKDCFTIDPKKVESAITSRTKAIIPVHLFGQSANLFVLKSIAQQYNLYLIEDCAQAIGCVVDSQKVGTIGDVGCFSFFPSKNLGGFGDAGLVITNNPIISEKLYSIRNHGMKEQYKHDRVGGNFRIDALQAKLLEIKLKYLEEAELRRLEHAELYFQLIKNPLISLPTVVRGISVWNQFTLRVPSYRNQLQRFLSENNISSAVYYPIPLHKQSCFSYLKDKFLIETERTCLECLSIPIAPELTEEQIQFVAEVIERFNVR